MKFDKQEHEGLPPISRHSELGPHGEGKHGFFTSTTSGAGAVKCARVKETSNDGLAQNVRGTLRHDVNGSPEYPSRQVHIGLWLIVTH